MSLTPQEIDEVKAQLREQVQNLPEPQKSQALQQIDSLSPQAVESLISQQKEKLASGQEKTIYRMIIDKEVESIKIGEDETAAAVLEINPVSKGHTLIIPKLAVSDKKNIPGEVFALAEKVSGKLMEGLGAKSIETQTETKFGEKIINLIPIYDSPVNLSSQRKKTQKSELEEVAKQLEPKPKKEIIKIKKEKSPEEEILKRKRRIA
ncbi:MAG: HIT domain-containing protein [Nanoarchaeota archaeon]|nr:HIT domain-containing protein [Nanoarchaeota archaeon]